MRNPTAAPAAPTPPTFHVISVMNRGYSQRAEALARCASTQNRLLRELLGAMEETKDETQAIAELRDWYKSHALTWPDTGEEHSSDVNLKWFDRERMQLGPFGEHAAPTVKEIVDGITARIEASNEGEALALSDAVNLALIRVGADPLSEPSERALTVGDAVSALKLALHSDLDFAWAWHCNIAVPLMDSSSLGHRLANQSAAHLMRHLFDVDITKYVHYRELMKRLDEEDQANEAGRPVPFTLGIDLSADGNALCNSMPPTPSTHHLYTEKASEVRTLLSGLYDLCKNKRHTHVSLSFGQLCDVMNLLEPVRQPEPSSVTILHASQYESMKAELARAAAAAESLRAVGDPAPRPDLLDTSKAGITFGASIDLGQQISEVAVDLVNTRAMARVSTTEPAEQPISIDMDKVVSAATGKRYTFDEFLDYGREQIRREDGGHMERGIPWSFRFHGWPTTHERDDLYLIGGGGFVTHHFNKADEISILPDGTFRIHSAALETLGQPSGNRRVLLEGDIVTMRDCVPEVLCEVVSYDSLKDLVRVRPCKVGEVPPGEFFSPRSLKLAPMSEASRAVMEAEQVRIAGHNTDAAKQKREDRIGFQNTTASEIQPPMRPTIGRRVWFFSDPRYGQSGLHVLDHFQPLDAGIVYVWNERQVNLDVTDHQGHHHAFTGVMLLQPGDPKPTTGYWCEWMPFQIKQARGSAK